jgi:hypothetical protein
MRGNFVTDRSGINNPNYKHGGKGTRLYSIWANMKTRCSNPKHMHFDRYGGRGITVCDEWKNDFQAFYDWAMSHGYSDDLSIDRIDNDKGYSPDNCRFIPMSIQNQNKRNVILLTYGGETLSTAQWEKRLGLGKNTISTRYHKGWSTEECLFGKRVMT